MRTNVPYDNSTYNRDAENRDTVYNELERARTATGYILGVYDNLEGEGSATPEHETDWTSPPDTATRGDAAEASSNYFATAGQIVRGNPIFFALAGVLAITSTFLLIRGLK